MTTNIEEILRVDDVLPFNPVTDVYQSFILDITPKQAQYILHYHNRDNRKISTTQVNKIFKSIENDNWLLDGQPITFNVEGNLTEGQHRLSAIVKVKDESRSFKVVIVTGVARDTFSKTATNKKRNPIDEIQRKHSDATQLEVSILGDLLKRRRVQRLSMQNAISNYEEWVKLIQNAIKMTGDFEFVMERYSLQRKTVGSFITLCNRFGYTEECRNFFDLLNSECENEKDPTTLTKQFNTYFDTNVAKLSNEKRMDIFYAMECLALDRILERDDGLIHFTHPDTFLSFEHGDMEADVDDGGSRTYRRFLG
tara:strand:- start:344 stop:1273 length:930 start_codon:yes stop_codon:yes gene_type:complete